jgi:competence protein ComEA
MDVVFAAGGFLANSDQASVNLARAVTDGEQVLVFEKGNNPNTTAVNGASQLMSLSRASAAELESLPGIGPTIAGRIIDWREANGGFKAVKDLLKVSGVGQKLFDGLKGEVSP